VLQPSKSKFIHIYIIQLCVTVLGCVPQVSTRYPPSPRCHSLSGTAFPIILFCHFLIIVLSCALTSFVPGYTLSVSVFIVDSLSHFGSLLLVLFYVLDCLSGFLTLCLDWFVSTDFLLKIGKCFLLLLSANKRLNRMNKSQNLEFYCILQNVPTFSDLGL